MCVEGAMGSKNNTRESEGGRSRQAQDGKGQRWNPCTVVCLVCVGGCGCALVVAFTKPLVHSKPWQCISFKSGASYTCWRKAIR